MIHKLSRRITVLELPRFQFPYCNCVWIDDDRTGLIDSSPDDGREFLKSRAIDVLLQSHGHLDRFFPLPLVSTPLRFSYTLPTRPWPNQPMPIWRNSAFIYWFPTSISISYTWMPSTIIPSRLPGTFRMGRFLTLAMFKFKSCICPGTQPDTVVSSFQNRILFLRLI